MSWRTQMTWSAPEKSVFSATIAFLEGRLQSREAIDWALRLPPSSYVERLALLSVLDRAAKELREPWHGAWRTIEEFWDQPLDGRSSTEAYHIQRRLADGDRSGALISSIQTLLAPRLKVTPFSAVDRRARKIPAKTREIRHLFAFGVTSNELINPALWSLATLDDAVFLGALSRALDSALGAGLDIAKRSGWDGVTNLWSLGDVRRVYHADRPNEERSDPDQHGRGVAPCVKMLHAVVDRLGEIAPTDAGAFMSRWGADTSPIYLRLWAALARSHKLASPDQVEAFLARLDDAKFWDLDRFPEVAELRARRFAEFGGPAQTTLIARLKKGPPRTLWRHEKDRERVEDARRYWSIREFRRIEAGEGRLPEKTQAWLAQHDQRFPALKDSIAIDEGFPSGATFRSYGPLPDDRYDALSGKPRLEALQAGLTSARVRWDDDPADAARAWIQSPGNTLLLLNDLESASEDMHAFPAVWETFGWSHSPDNPQNGDSPVLPRSLAEEATRVFSLLLKLSDETIKAAISGLSYWLTAWEKVATPGDVALAAWRRLWPFAVAATNAEQDREGEVEPSFAGDSADQEPADLDSLNTPAGRLVGVFIAAWAAERGADRFATGTKPQIMRDIIIETEGRAGLIAKHRMIEFLGFFEAAIPAWTREHLFPSLVSDGPEAALLWRAVARRGLSGETLKALGEELLKRTVDPMLGRETRKSLVFSIVVGCLHAMYANLDQPVALPRIQQMLRALDDEVRAHAADAVGRFVHDNVGRPLEQNFQQAAAPFLKMVWPQERSISTPGISREFANLPASSGGAFAEAVAVIERFLVPFDCWSLLDYGLYGDDDMGKPKLSRIDNPEKAQALLTLLDRTVGATEGAVIPHDLAQALARIKDVAPALEATQAFRRLSTAAR